MPKATKKPLEARIDYVAKFFSMEKPELFSGCMLTFYGYVLPDEDLEDDDLDHLELLALEWFIYDCVLPNGMTPLQFYNNENPDERGKTVMRRLKEAEESHFADDFWLVEADAESGLIKLRSISDNSLYEIRNEGLSAELDGENGEIGLRLAKVGGEWMLAGGVVYHYPDAPPMDVLDDAEGFVSTPRSLFIDMVADEYGDILGLPPDFDDEMLSQLRIPQSLEEVPEILALVEEDYKAMCSKYQLSMTWPELVEAILREDGEHEAIDLIQRLYEDAGLSDVSAIFEVVSTCSAAWDLLPHNSLGGISPFQFALEIEEDLTEEDLPE